MKRMLTLRLGLLLLLTLFSSARGKEEDADWEDVNMEEENPFAVLLNTPSPPTEDAPGGQTSSPPQSSAFLVSTRVLNAFPTENDAAMTVVFAEDRVVGVEYGKVAVGETRLRKKEDFVIQFSNPNQGGIILHYC